MARDTVYQDEVDLDNLVCPTEPEPPKPDWLKQYEVDRQRAEQEEEALEDAREIKSRDFRISEKSVTGGSPEEEY